MLHEPVEIYLDVSPSFKRVDMFIAKCSGLKFSRSFSQKLIKDGLVEVNGKKIKSNHIMKKYDRLSIMLPVREEKSSYLPEDIPIDVIYEDEDILLVNKQPGIVVHPAAGNRDGTLVNALLHHYEHLSDFGGGDRPGIVHRLDKDTSGLMVIAKNNNTHKELSHQFSSRQVDKVYIALVRGRVIRNETTVSLSLGRDINDRKKISNRTVKPREATTDIRVLERLGGYTLLELFPKTGRTHQLRVHLQYLGHPIIGDKVYGKGECKVGGVEVKRQLLHARQLTFTHPVSGEKVDFTAEVPDDFKVVLSALSSNCIVNDPGG